jgi:hypothetical protein
MLFHLIPLCVICLALHLAACATLSRMSRLPQPVRECRWARLHRVVHVYARMQE